MNRTQEDIRFSELLQMGMTPKDALTVMEEEKRQISERNQAMMNNPNPYQPNYFDQTMNPNPVIQQDTMMLGQ